MEGRVAFPTRLVPLAKRTTNKAAFETIVAEEEGRVLRRERREKLKKVDPYTALFAVAIFYLLNVYIWHNYAKPPPGLRRKVLQRITRQLRTGGIGRAFWPVCGWKNLHCHYLRPSAPRLFND